MMVTEEQQISEVDIPRYFSLFEKYANRVATYWCDRYRGTVDLDDLASAAYVAIWEALKSFSYSGGSSLRPWVRHKVWEAVRNEAQKRYQRRLRRRHVNTLLGQHYDEIILPSVESVDPHEISDRFFAERLQQHLKETLNERDWNVFKWRVIDGAWFEEIGRRLGTSKAYAEKKSRHVIKLARLAAAKLPGAADYDVHNVVKETVHQRQENLKRIRNTPRYRRLASLAHVHGFEWVHNGD